MKGALYFVYVRKGIKIDFFRELCLCFIFKKKNYHNIQLFWNIKKPAFVIERSSMHVSESSLFSLGIL